MRKGATGWTLLLTLPLVGACLRAPSLRADGPVPPQENLIVNGGFEEWSDLEPSAAALELVRNVTLVPPNRAPTGWIPMREIDRDHPEHTGTITMDEQVKHSGARSVRLENRDMRDITLVQYSTERFTVQPDDAHNIRPSRRYLLRWWVRGDGVEASGTGPILMMFVMSQRDGSTGLAAGGKWSRTDTYEHGSLPTGTFDWQQRQFAFITDESACWANFTLQLRWTTGTIWYDGVELVDTGPVVHVETY
jgi:hypothetical protein